jgi:hypothetical protein
MQKRTFYILLVFCLLFSGCVRKEYRATAKVCDKKLFVEIYNVNSFGVDAEYLTDSVSFRKYVGKFDEEHERYIYTCNGDSLNIIKTVYGNRWAKDTVENGMHTVIGNLDTIEKQSFSISQLKKLNNYN